MASSFDAWADVYDSVYSYVVDDIPFYVQAARESGGPVLELGCGTGRVSIPVAEARVDVVALDSSGEMLDVARRKASGLTPDAGTLKLVQADMRDLDQAVDEKFNLVIIPFRGFLSLLSVEDQTRTLNGIKGCLAQGGKLIFNIFVPDLDMLVQEGDVPYHLRDVTDPDTAARFVLYHQSSYDNHDQVIFTRLIVEELDQQGTMVKRLYRDFQLRYVHRWEMHHLLQLSGFEVLDLFGDFEGSPFDESSTEMVWVARPFD